MFAQPATLVNLGNSVFLRVYVKRGIHMTQPLIPAYHFCAMTITPNQVMAALGTKYNPTSPVITPRPPTYPSAAMTHR
jgi:hypothetical protein